MALISARFLRYLLSGGLNTALTYLLYLALMPVVGAVPAYAVAYLGGLAVSYVANRNIVFSYRGAHRQVVVKYAATHLGILSVSSMALEFFVSHGVSRFLAPPLVVLNSVPVSFYAFRLLFSSRSRPTLPEGADLSKADH